MRGSPLLQVAVLLVSLAAVAWAGLKYIDAGKLPPIKEVKPKKIVSSLSSQNEISLTFSSLPQKVILKRVDNGSEFVLFSSEKADAIENPIYIDSVIPAEVVSSYWLDIMWERDAADSTRHFAQVVFSPLEGEEKKYVFQTELKEMNETFEHSSIKK